MYSTSLEESWVNWTYRILRPHSKQHDLFAGNSLPLETLNFIGLQAIADKFIISSSSEVR